jgi:hypothetical protein
LPAHTYPQPLNLGEDQIRHHTIDHRVWSLPASVAQIEDGLVRVAVVYQKGLFSTLVLKIAEVLIGTDVIDMR